MKIDESELRTLSLMPETDLLKLIGGKALSSGLGAAEVSEEEKEEEGRRIVEGLKPSRPGICSDPRVRAFISGTNTELGTDLLAVVGDVTFHVVLPVPVLTLTVVFIRFGLRKYCAHA